MEIIREITSLSNRLRQRLGIPLSQKLLDFAYGWFGEDGFHLFEKERKLLAEAVGIETLGCPLTVDYFELYNSNEPPEGWEVEEGENYWIALNTETPRWLKDQYKESRKHRLLMVERKEKGLWV